VSVLLLGPAAVDDEAVRSGVTVPGSLQAEAATSASTAAAPTAGQRRRSRAAVRTPPW
jgi:hypothetical protein